MAYQDFDGTGDSKSHEKLKALRLEDLAALMGRDRTAPPLHGLAVLDLGCNEGFFCIEAVRQGASRVVGIDANAGFIDAARRRCPQATFVNSTWWDIPNEQFDVVLFLSSMHYEPDPRGLFDKIARHLRPGGRLILECGVFQDRNVYESRAWRTVRRTDGVKRYPTPDLLTRDLLSTYSVRRVGQSVPQVGDPVPRFVYHCGLKVPVALLISASSGAGKTSLSMDLDAHGIPKYSTDMLLWRLGSEERHSWRPVAQFISAKFPEKGPAFDNSLGEMGVLVAEAGFGPEFAEIVVQESPGEAGLFCIEGDALRHELILSAVIAGLEAANIRPWILTPQEGSGARSTGPDPA